MRWAFTHHAAARLAERHGIADPYGFLVARAPSATYLHPKGRNGLVWSFGDGVRVVSVRTQSWQTAITVLPPLDNPPARALTFRYDQADNHPAYSARGSRGVARPF